MNVPKLMAYLTAAALYLLPFPIHSLPCFAFCGDDLINVQAGGGIVDEYLATPTIDHFDDALKRRSEETIELARKVLNGILSDKLKELDEMAKNSIDLAEKRLRAISSDALKDLDAVFSQNIDKIKKALDESEANIYVILTTIIAFLSPSLILASTAAALIAVFVVFLMRKRRKNAASFEWSALIKISAVTTVFGIGLAAFSFFFISHLFQFYNEKQMFRALEERRIVDAVFFAHALNRSDGGNKRYKNYERRVLLLQDIVFRPQRASQDADDMLVRAMETVSSVFNEEQIFDEASFSLIPVIYWTGHKNRISEFIAAQLAAVALQEGNTKEKWPVTSIFEGTMRTIIRNYLMFPLSAEEIAFGEGAWKQATEALPLSVKPIDPASLLSRLGDTSQVEYSGRVRALSIHTSDAYFHVVDTISKRSLMLSATDLTDLKKYIDNILSEWDAFLNSAEYKHSSKTEKIFTLKSPVALLGRIADYAVALQKNEIRSAPNLSCQGYVPESDDRDEQDRKTDRNLRTIAGFIAPTRSLDTIIDKLMSALVDQRLKDKLPYAAVLALRTEVLAASRRLTKDLYEMEDELVFTRLPEDAIITDCLKVLPKNMQCGMPLRGDI
ncbi:hypothetical protein [Caballeronia sp. AZ7_KS35]|uniref:hypothetical protein n=1 Tax=Caballeronia sp. AZ7_KS35 TaxID=2921762 RepID=UPI00202990F8|nr:hypothetical protein [Caballeronia sp. AZ7_KS35]